MAVYEKIRPSPRGQQLNFHRHPSPTSGHLESPQAPNSLPCTHPGKCGCTNDCTSRKTEKHEVYLDPYSETKCVAVHPGPGVRMFLEQPRRHKIITASVTSLISHLSLLHVIATDVTSLFFYHTFFSEVLGSRIMYQTRTAL